MKKEKIIQILRKSAISYNKNLENRNFMVIYKENNKVKYIQIRFSAGNFLHLTGIQLNKNVSAMLFYKKCLNGKISNTDIILRKDGTTELKLSILEMITNICMTAKMLGEYNHLKLNLYTELLIGTNFISLGLIKINNNFYIPNTAIKENTKKLIYNSNRIIAIFSKKINEKSYNKVCLIKNEEITDKEILQKLDNNIKEILNYK